MIFTFHSPSVGLVVYFLPPIQSITRGVEIFINSFFFVVVFFFYAITASLNDKHTICSFVVVGFDISEVRSESAYGVLTSQCHLKTRLATS